MLKREDEHGRAFLQARDHLGPDDARERFDKGALVEGDRFRKEIGAAVEEELGH